MEKDTSLAIGVFVKLPVPGRVKTRLAKTEGPERAARLYAKMVGLVIDRALRPLDRKRFVTYFLCDPFAPIVEYQKFWSHTGFDFLPQVEGDLGQRLSAAHMTLTEKHGAAALIGSDCIEISPATFEACASWLQTDADAVLGPAVDGGYYLIATRKPCPELFLNVEWSTPQVLEATLKNATRANLKVRQLTPLSDIDEAYDLKKYPELIGL